MVTLLFLIATIFELIGVILMANAFLGIKNSQILRVILSSLFWGNYARKASKFSRLNEENKQVSLAGFSYLIVGFMFQLIAIVTQLYNTEWA
jgi:uncharacterized membrane protein